MGSSGFGQGVMVLCLPWFVLGKREGVPWLTPAHPHCSAKIHPLPASPFLNERQIIRLTKNNYLATNWVLAYELEFNI